MTTTETTDTDIEATDPPPPTAPGPETVLVLRTCDSGMRSYGGFRWPESGHVEAATAGWRGTATAGDRGTLVIHHYMASTDTYRARVAEVDGETILAGVAYRLNPAGEFVAAEAEAGRG